MRQNKYIDNCGLIDVRALAMHRNELLAEAQRREQIVINESDVLRQLNREFALFLLGCLVVTGALIFGASQGWFS